MTGRSGRQFDFLHTEPDTDNAGVQYVQLDSHQGSIRHDDDSLPDQRTPTANTYARVPADDREDPFAGPQWEAGLSSETIEARSGLQFTRSQANANSRSTDSLEVEHTRVRQGGASPFGDPHPDANGGLPKALSPLKTRQGDPLDLSNRAPLKQVEAQSRHRHAASDTSDSDSSASLLTSSSTEKVGELLKPPGLCSRNSSSSSIDILMPMSDVERGAERDEKRHRRRSGLGLYEFPPPEVSTSAADSQRPTVKMKLPGSPDYREISPTRHGFHRKEDSEHGLNSSAFTSPTVTDYEDSTDEYDWSGEEDLADEASKYVERIGQKPKKKGWGPKRIFALAFSSLIGSTLTAGIVALPAILVHFYWYEADPTDHRKYVDQNVQAWLFWVAANIVVSWYLAMIIDLVPVIALYLLSAVWGHISETVKTRVEMYNAVKDTFKPAFYAASWIASWVIIFAHIYGLYSLDDEEESRAPYTDRAYQVVLFLFFFVLVVCIQKMLTHFVAWNFHRTAYKDRIESVEACLAVVEKLQQYKPKRHYPKASSGSRTPMFGSSRYSQSYDMNVVNARLSAITPRPPLSRLASAVTTISQLGSSDHGHDGDVEDGDKTLIGGVDGKKKLKKQRKTTSWFRKSKKQTDAETAISLRELATEEKKTTPTEFERIHIHPPDASPIPSRPGSPGPGGPSRSRRSSIDSRHRRMHSEAEDHTLVKTARVIKKAVLHDARNIRGKDRDLSSLAWNINSTTEAKRLARSLFYRLRDRRRKYLIPADFYPVFPTKEQAEEAFAVFDTDHNDDLSRAEIKRTLVRTYRERRFLSRALRDAGEAVKTLDRILLAFALIILFFISLSVFGVEVGDSLSSVYSIFIAASFIFKSSASRAFDAIMFLFVTHPYDTGDRVFVDNENLVVKKMGLFATIFTRADGTETYYFNSQLFNKFTYVALENYQLHTSNNDDSAELMSAGAE
ncbi:hypothetical protein CC2G_010377 [Coprinopsis cinerea AmutBmut pab1-1]|nr:hypothetical protein CC2G_010377 [Coprinopsis cinerea AmutBmut pab1-1]